MMVRTAWRIGRIVLGGTCIGVGIIGLFLPFVQGILLLAVGISLLSAESPRIKGYEDRVRAWLGRQLNWRAKDNGNGRERSIW